MEDEEDRKKKSSMSNANRPTGWDVHEQGEPANRDRNNFVNLQAKVLNATSVAETSLTRPEKIQNRSADSWAGKVTNLFYLQVIKRSSANWYGRLTGSPARYTCETKSLVFVISNIQYKLVVISNFKTVTGGRWTINTPSTSISRHCCPLLRTSTSAVWLYSLRACSSSSTGCQTWAPSCDRPAPCEQPSPPSWWTSNRDKSRCAIQLQHSNQWTKELCQWAAAAFDLALVWAQRNLPPPTENQKAG